MSALTQKDINRQNKAIIANNHERIMRYVIEHMGPGMNKISEVTQNIFLSGMENALNIDELRSCGIEAILYLGRPKKTPEMMSRYKKKKITQYQIPIEDEPKLNIMPYLENCYQFIHSFIQEERKVLIHCDRGVSLAPTVLAYYFMKRYYLTNFQYKAPADKRSRELMNRRTCYLMGVISMLKEFRPCIRPSPPLVHQLLVVEQQLKTWLADIMVKLEKDLPPGENSDSDNIEATEHSDSSEDLFESKVDKTKKPAIVHTTKKKSPTKKTNPTEQEDYDTLDSLADIAPLAVPEPIEMSQSDSSTDDD